MRSWLSEPNPECVNVMPPERVPCGPATYQPPTQRACLQHDDCCFDDSTKDTSTWCYRKGRPSSQLLHTRPFNGPLPGTTWVSQYQKGKINLNFMEVRDSQWQWHQLGHMQVSISLQADNHANSTPSLCLRRRAYVLPLFHIFNDFCQTIIISTSTGPAFTKFAGLVELRL